MQNLKHGPRKMLPSLEGPGPASANPADWECDIKRFNQKKS